MSTAWPVFLSLCVDAFPHQVTADDAIRFWSAQGAVPVEDASWIAHLYRKSGILKRHLSVNDMMVLPLYGSVSAVLEVPIEQRLDRARTAVFPLVYKTATRAIAEADIDIANIGQIVVVSSTILATPGLDVDLINALGLSRSIVRTGVTFAGCAAGIQGMAHASSFFARSGAGPARATLLVCVEASSLHSFFHTDKSQRVSHAIFGDGVVCAVIGAASPDSEKDAGKVAIRQFASALLPDITDGIVLGVSAQGITCSLSPRLPQAIVDNVGGWLASLLEQASLTRDDIGFWTIHTGGKKILESVQAGLGITREQIESSWNILEQYGNTISCGVLYVLHDMLSAGRMLSGQTGVMLSFAPGVSAEGVLIKVL